MTRQKTWIDLLGVDASQCEVDDKYIIRKTIPNHCVVLHCCDNHEQALECYATWLKEIEEAENKSEITWSTDVNAPSCAGEIVNHDGRTVLIQTDWDYPGVASTFGWSVKDVQHCRKCKKPLVTEEIPPTAGDVLECEDCGYKPENVFCDHDSTDGTVTCKQCGLTASDFISSAYDFLRDNDGATAEDPGYFLGD